MEVSGTVLRQVTYIYGAGTRVVVPRGRCGGGVRVRMVMDSSFRDEGHLQYYQDRLKGGQPVLTSKKKLKLLKNLSKGAYLFPEPGFALDPDQCALFDYLQGNLTKDAEEVLLKKLEQLKADEKELKRKRKQEKKAKLKAKMKNCESSSSSSSSESESSDSDCDKVVDMNSFRTGVSVAPEPVNDLQASMLSQPALLPQTTVAAEDSTPLCSTNDASVGSVGVGFKNESNVVTNGPQKRIEVCMGNKCKRSGAAALLQEFERVVGVEGGAVVGCKCMGKCKSAPNVRVQNSVDHGLAQGLNDSVKVPANPLCIGVGLEDVDTIVARFLGDESPRYGYGT